MIYRYNIRIPFTYYALNVIDVCTEDINNDYLQDPSSKNDFIIYGKEFGLENIGKTLLIRREFYGGM